MYLEYESDFEESLEDDEPLLNRVCEYMKRSVEAENKPILSPLAISLDDLPSALAEISDQTRENSSDSPPVDR